MRPEFKEYNYDWLMSSVLSAASAVANGSEKETELAYKYIPYFKGVSKFFIDHGDVGIQVLKLFDAYYKNILNAHDQGKKIGLTTFCFSPAILYAMNVVPVCTEMLTALGNIVWRRGMFEYMDYGCQVGLPETSCSSQRGALGAYFAGLAESIDLVVCSTPGVCDTNANAFSFASSYLDIPYYALNFPQTLGDDRSEGYHLADYKELIRFIEAQTGNKMDYDLLDEVLAEVERQNELIADIEDLQSLRPSPMSPMYNIALYAGRYTFSGHKEYTRLLETILNRVKQRAAAGICGLKTGKEKLRAFMFYIDHYNLDMNFWNYFDEKGIAHMGGMLSHHFSEEVSYTSKLDGVASRVDRASREGMLNSIAMLNSRLPMVRSIRGPYDGKNMWLEETLVLAENFGADCLIYNGTPGCRNTWANVKMIARDLEKHGYPTHIMYDDAFDDRVESWAATKERLDEFFTIRGLL
jgi:hypothetical protein